VPLVRPAGLGDTKLAITSLVGAVLADPSVLEDDAVDPHGVVTL
jgi:hypothetical protein